MTMDLSSKMLITQAAGYATVLVGDLVSIDAIIVIGGVIAAIPMALAIGVGAAVMTAK